MIRTRKTISAPKRYSSAGRIRLRILDFGRQQIVPVESIVEAIDRLPARHLARLTQIEYDPERASQWEVAVEDPQLANFTCEGAYFLASKKIAIYAIGKRDHFFHVLHHEIGHHVYHCVLTGTQRGVWLKLWREICKTTRPAENADEYFAECYAWKHTGHPELCGYRAIQFFSTVS